MPMPDTFFSENLTGQTALIDGPEAHHALHVLRLKVGGELRLIDGCGTVATGVVAQTTRSSVTVDIEEKSSHARRKSSVTVAAAIPKGDRLKWMIEKVAELGIDRFVPLSTERSVVDVRKCSAQKLRSTLIAVAKQSRQPWLMEIAEPVTLAAFAASFEGRLFVAHPGDSAVSVSVAGPRGVIIGPEGGLTDGEVEGLVATGVSQVAWPGSILRIETAAIVFGTQLIAG